MSTRVVRATSLLRSRHQSSTRLRRRLLGGPRRPAAAAGYCAEVSLLTCAERTASVSEMSDAYDASPTRPTPSASSTRAPRCRSSARADHGPAGVWQTRDGRALGRPPGRLDRSGRSGGASPDTYRARCRTQTARAAALKLTELDWSAAGVRVAPALTRAIPRAGRRQWWSAYRRRVWSAASESWTWSSRPDGASRSAQWRRWCSGSRWRPDRDGGLVRGRGRRIGPRPPEPSHWDLVQAMSDDDLPADPRTAFGQVVSRLGTRWYDGQSRERLTAVAQPGPCWLMLTRSPRTRPACPGSRPRCRVPAGAGPEPRHAARGAGRWRGSLQDTPRVTGPSHHRRRR